MKRFNKWQANQVMTIASSMLEKMKKEDMMKVKKLRYKFIVGR